MLALKSLSMAGALHFGTALSARRAPLPYVCSMHVVVNLVLLRCGFWKAMGGLTPLGWVRAAFFLDVLGFRSSLETLPSDIVRQSHTLSRLTTGGGGSARFLRHRVALPKHVNALRVVRIIVRQGILQGSRAPSVRRCSTRSDLSVPLASLPLHGASWADHHTFSLLRFSHRLRLPGRDVHQQLPAT